ncbi:MAG: 30S ribosomal protein S15 [Thermoplasmataceae archaeon]|jgi:small subunit ribosomal protein S15
MARMHKRKRGKSGSKNIYLANGRTWVEQSPTEISEIILNSHKENLTLSQIGIRLRDQYGIPGTKHVMGKKIGKILSENNSSPSIPDDLNSLIQKYKRVTKHINMNKKDMSNTRGKNLIMAKMLRLVKYYKREGYLAKEWELNKVL